MEGRTDRSSTGFCRAQSCSSEDGLLALDGLVLGTCGLEGHGAAPAVVSTWELVLGSWCEGGFSSRGCPTSPWELGVSWAGSLGDGRVISALCVHPCPSCGMCSDILLQAELLQWHEGLAELLALALGLICDSLMADLSPPSTRGVLGVQGRAL